MHNWIAYEETLKPNSVLEKMVIRRVVYSLGDSISQVTHLKYKCIFSDKKKLIMQLVHSLYQTNYIVDIHIAD